jgi:arabinofuranosyltransferase
MRRAQEREPVLDRISRGLVFLLQKPNAWISLFSASFVIVLCNYFSHLYFHNVCDDSLISMQYARNLAMGNGLVFNLGERVEGYTNFLWILLIAPIFSLSRLLSLDFVRVAVQFSIIIAAVDVMLVVVVGRILWKRSLLPLIAAVGFCIFDNDYTVWAIQALESHLVIFWTLLAVLLWQQHRSVWLGITLACLVMSRPDSVLFVAILLGNDALAVGLGLFRKKDRLPGGEDNATSLTEFITTLSVFVFLFGGYFLWRYSYYGYLLPNTYYLKIQGLYLEAIPRGTYYLKAFLSRRGWIPLVVLLNLFWVRDRIIRVLLLWLLAHTAYVVYVGGDFYPGSRFFVVTVPVIALLIGHLVHKSYQLISRRLNPSDLRIKRVAYRLLHTAFSLLLLGTLVHFAQLGFSRGPYRIEILRWGEHYHETYAYIKWLGEQSPKKASILTGDIGSSGFFGNFYVIDFYGVIDPLVAHQEVSSFGRGKPGHEKQADATRLLLRHPTYIRPGYVPEDLSDLGYYLSDDGPDDHCGLGIWARDPLSQKGYWEDEHTIHFGRAQPKDWRIGGDAFHPWGALDERYREEPVRGASGFFLSSYHPIRGDDAVGWARSGKMLLSGDLMVLRVGGGRDPERLRVSLIVDGERHFSATGCDRELLSRRIWDISALKGKEATLEIVDEVRGSWGHIMVDEIRQWRSR